MVSLLKEIFVLLEQMYCWKVFWFNNLGSGFAFQFCRDNSEFNSKPCLLHRVLIQLLRHYRKLPLAFSDKMLLLPLYLLPLVNIFDNLLFFMINKSHLQNADELCLQNQSRHDCMTEYNYFAERLEDLDFEWIYWNEIFWPY